MESNHRHEPLRATKKFIAAGYLLGAASTNVRQLMTSRFRSPVRSNVHTQQDTSTAGGQVSPIAASMLFSNINRLTHRHWGLSLYKDTLGKKILTPPATEFQLRVLQ